MDQETGRRSSERRGAHGRGAASGNNEQEARNPQAEREHTEPAAAAGDHGNGASAAVDDLIAQLEQEQTRAKNYYQSWQRAAADYQNLKRRTDQEREEMRLYAGVSFILNLLPIIDDFERATSTIDAGLAGLTWVQGMQAIYQKFRMLLDASGVQEIPAAGEPFDPNLHEAVGETEGEPGKVVAVLQKGYTLNDRVIRPAMVMVGKRK